MADCCGQYVLLFAFGTIFAFITAFGIGANDCANSFATSVGARSLKLWQAVIVAAIFEFLGAVLLGSEVADTVAKKIVDPDLFESQPALLMAGNVCALFSTGMWLLFASKLGLPVSTTHSIIGSLVGFGLVAYGTSAIGWNQIYMIIASWFVSPILAGVVSAILYFVTRTFVLRADNSAQRSLRFYPILVGVTIAINIFFVVLKGAKRFSSQLKNLPIWVPLVSAIGAGIVCGVLLYFTFVKCYLAKRVKQIEDGTFDPDLRDKTVARDSTDSLEQGVPRTESGSFDTKISQQPLDKSNALSGCGGSIKDAIKNLTHVFTSGFTFDVHDVARKDDATKAIHDNAETFPLATEYTFTYLQVFTACMASFAHGSNDVANSIGPYASIYVIYTTGMAPSKANVPIWILAFGGLSIALGLALLGHRVIQTMGVELFKVTPSRGFAIELASSLVSVVGSILGLPLSTTHCQVGSEIGVGLLESYRGINWGVCISFHAHLHHS